MEKAIEVAKRVFIFQIQAIFKTIDRISYENWCRIYKTHFLVKHKRKRALLLGSSAFLSPVRQICAKC